MRMLAFAFALPLLVVAGLSKADTFTGWHYEQSCHWSAACEPMHRKQSTSQLELRRASGRAR